MSPIKISVSVASDQEVARDLRGLPRKQAKATRAGLTRGANRVLRYLRRSVLAGQVIHRRSGKLSRSFSVKKARKRGNVTEALLLSDSPYALIHETGGVIRARNAPYLHFQVDGQWARVKEVTIPERRYLSIAMEAKEDAVVEELGLAIETVLEGFRRGGGSVGVRERVIG